MTLRMMGSRQSEKWLRLAVRLAGAPQADAPIAFRRRRRIIEIPKKMPLCYE
jgi:hypothetical protein